MNNSEILSLEGMGLSMWATRRIVCPWCNGGPGGEVSMNLTRKPDGLAYNCHRASCGVRGYVGSVAAFDVNQEPARKERIYTGPVQALTADDYDYFEGAYELPFTAIDGFIYRSYDGRYILPIIWRGEDRGYVLRKPWPGAPIAQPWQGIKSDVYLHDSSKAQHALYNRKYPDRPVVIVEDQLSAMKVVEANNNVYAVALLGSLLNLEKVREIQQLRGSEVIFALDADATALSFRYARDFGLAFPKARVAILEKDLKDTKLSDIPAVLSL
jgi:hypothetical protein